MDDLKVLRDRVNALLKRHSAIGQERDSLRKELQQLRAEHEDLKEKHRQMEEALLAMQIGKSIPDEALRAQSRKKLDEVIGEIDKILTTLND